jgi:uncharacterized protein (TIGR03546 family)
MLWFNFIRKLVLILHSQVSPAQIAFGAALGAVMGLNPAFSLQNIIILFFIIFLNVNFAAAFLSAALFGLIGFFTDPLAHQLGYLLLVRVDALAPLWTSLYNTPIVPFTRFYNTVVLGSFVLGLALFIPVVLVTMRLIVLYRTRLQARVESLKIVKMLKLSNLYNIYDRYK